MDSQQHLKINTTTKNLTIITDNINFANIPAGDR